MLSRRAYDLGALYLPDEVKFGLGGFYTSLLGSSTADLLPAYESQKDAFQAALEDAAESIRQAWDNVSPGA